MYKVILSTITVTTIAILFAILLFLDNFLSLFGFAKIPLKELNRLYQSKQIIKQLKTNNKKYQSKIALLKNNYQNKKINISKKVQKRLKKRIPLLATSVPIIGAVATIPIIIKFEVDDYCANKKELLNDENILFDTSKIFDETACLDDALKDTKKFSSNKYQSISSDIDNYLKLWKSKWYTLWGNQWDKFMGKSIN